MNFEICEKCYRNHFFVTWEYENMRIEVSKELYKCHGCGQYKQVVRKVFAGDELIDLN